jgi:hypothetical protein
MIASHHHLEQHESEQADSLRKQIEIHDQKNGEKSSCLTESGDEQPYEKPTQNLNKRKTMYELSMEFQKGKDKTTIDKMNTDLDHSTTTIPRSLFEKNQLVIDSSSFVGINLHASPAKQ